MDNPCKWLNATEWDNITELDKYVHVYQCTCIAAKLYKHKYIHVLYSWSDTQPGLILNLAYMYNVCMHHCDLFCRLASFMGIANSFEQYPRDWHQWFTSAEPENTPLPGTVYLVLS